jgi:hypothetical protein
MAGWLVNWTEAIVTYIEVLCLDGPTETMENLRIVGFLAGIRTEHLSTTSMDHYSYANPLGTSLLYNQKADRQHILLLALHSAN